jgi:hypothetical protein
MESVRFDSRSIVLGAYYSLFEVEFVSTFQQNFTSFEEESSEDFVMFTGVSYQRGRLALDNDLLVFNDLSSVHNRFRGSVNISRGRYILGQINYSSQNTPLLKHRIMNQQRGLYQGGYRFSTHDRSHTSSLMFGARTIEQSRDTDLIYDAITQTFPIFSADTQVTLPIRDMSLVVNNNFTYQLVNPEFYLIPRLINILDISLTRNLENDNWIRLGANINSISPVRTEVFGTTGFGSAFDAYFAFGVSKLFDMRIGFYNLFNSPLFGNEQLTGRHIAASVVWYFKN